MTQATTTPPSLRKAQRRFLHHLRDLVLEEAEATRRRIHRQWQRPLPARVADGYAIENVRLVQHHANGQLELECRRNRSRFRPGDVLCPNRGDPFAHPRLTVILEADDETHLRVSGDTPTAWDLAGAPADGWVLDTDFLDVSGYILGALNKVGDTLVGWERILLSPEEQTDLIRDNTRKLYMAIIRAGQRLVITYVGPPPEILRPGEKVSGLRR